MHKDYANWRASLLTKTDLNIPKIKHNFSCFISVVFLFKCVKQITSTLRKTFCNVEYISSKLTYNWSFKTMEKHKLLEKNRENLKSLHNFHQNNKCKFSEHDFQLLHKFNSMFICNVIKQVFTIFFYISPDNGIKIKNIHWNIKIIPFSEIWFPLPKFFLEIFGACMIAETPDYFLKVHKNIHLLTFSVLCIFVVPA